MLFVHEFIEELKQHVFFISGVYVTMFVNEILQAFVNKNLNQKGRKIGSPVELSPGLEWGDHSAGGIL